jgi:CTD small phosphatase-like protein 2
MIGRNPSSPYAAPSSPIASAKRARMTASSTVDSSYAGAKSPSPSGKGTITGSKISSELDDCLEEEIFSPALHLDGVQHEHRHHADIHYHPSHPHHVPYDPDASHEENEDVEEEIVGPEDDEEEFNPYLFISSLPAYSTVRGPCRICLPVQKTPRRQTLALDLDETLVHCTVDPISHPDHVFNVMFNDNSYQVYVRKRPYLDYFLETVSKLFEVVVFTASQQVYADRLLDLIDVDKAYVHHRLFRESCLHIQGNYLKDLCVLGRDMSSTMLVDNSPHAYGYQIDNGIPIESWFDDEGDTELLKLSGFLKKLQDVPDVRPLIREHFKTFKLVERASRRGVISEAMS